MLVAAAVVATSVHGVVASESLSDQASLALIACVVAGVLFAAGVAARNALARSTGRSGATRCALPLGLLVICALFVKASVTDASVEMEALVEANGAPEAPASIVLGPGGHDVRLSGEIGEGAAARLAALLAANPGVGRIVLTSDGGLADEGQALGDVIAAHGLDTFVPDFCVSACTLAFVRGRERVLQSDGRLGFHAPYEQGLFGALYRGDSSDQRNAYLAAGLTPEFVDAALKIDPADVWFPKLDRLRAAGVVTASVDSYSLPDASLDGAATLGGSRALILRNFPLMSAFGKRSTQGVDAIASWYLDAYRSGRSEGENTDALKAVVEGAVGVGLARADDATLLDLARFLRSAMSSADAPDDCVAIGENADLVRAASRMDDGGGGTPAATGLLDRALGGHAATTADAVFSGAQAVAAGQDASCVDWQRAYDRILREPAAAGAAAMRAIVDAQAARALATLHLVRQQRHG